MATNLRYYTSSEVALVCLDSVRGAANTAAVTDAPALLRDAATLGIREIVPQRVYALGGVLPLDERLSWAPHGRRGFQATSCYLLKEGDAHMLIDPGPAYHEQLLMRQLEHLVARDAEMSIFFTRQDYDCTGSLGPIPLQYRVRRLLAGGNANPYDGFDDLSVTNSRYQAEIVRTARIAKNAAIDVAPGRDMLLIEAPLRMNTTFWAYDVRTRCLFTAEAFSHAVYRSEREAFAGPAGGIVDESDAAVWDHLLGAFWYLSDAYTAPLIEELDAVFTAHPIEHICPSRGGVISGRGAVEGAYLAVRRVLQKVHVVPS